MWDFTLVIYLVMYHKCYLQRKWDNEYSEVFTCILLNNSIYGSTFIHRNVCITVRHYLYAIPQSKYEAIWRYINYIYIHVHTRTFCGRAVPLSYCLCQFSTCQAHKQWGPPHLLHTCKLTVLCRYCTSQVLSRTVGYNTHIQKYSSTFPIPCPKPLGSFSTSYLLRDWPRLFKK